MPLETFFWNRLFARDRFKRAFAKAHILAHADRFALRLKDATIANVKYVLS
jgi:hypothetical protein